MEAGRAPPPYGPGTTSEVWVSEDGGFTWTRKADASWLARHCAGWVVFNNKIFVISGDGNDDVWSSEDGEHWVQECSNAPFGKRYAPYVAVFNNKLWLMGGLSYWEDGQYIHPRVKAFNDVWSSEDGQNWEKVIDCAPWAPRGLIHGYAVKNDTLYILGGGIKSGIIPGGGSETVAEYNDVWSTTDGLNWTRILYKAPWLPRTHFSVFSTPEYIYITDGSVGQQAVMSNEVWRSRDGIMWEHVEITPWSPRHASALTYHNGYLYVSSGYFVADVWRMPTE